MPGASGGAPTSTMDAQDAEALRRLGVPEQQLQVALQQAQPAEPAAADDLVLAEHLWPVVRLFDALRTQWRAVAGPAGLVRYGLDYSAIAPTARMLGMRAREVGKATFEHLRVLEDETLKVLLSQVQVTA